jgi:hypothetical protein
MKGTRTFLADPSYTFFGRGMETMVALADVQRIVETPAPPVLTIKALCDVGTIERVTNIFTRRGVIPAFLSVNRGDPYLLIDVQLSRDDGFDEILLEKLRALVCVVRADWVRVVK